MVDGIFKKDIGLKRVMWGFPKQNTFGVGPVVDVYSKGELKVLISILLSVNLELGNIP
jgi:hypothetical protein